MSGERIVLVRQPTVVAVTAPGPQGPQGAQGPAGAPGGSAYVHTQAAPSASWVIDHNLGRKVHVSVVTDLGRLVFADVEHGSLNQTTVTFPGPVTGAAILS